MKRGIRIIIINLILMVVIISVIEMIITKSPYIWSDVSWEGRSLGGMTTNGAALYIEKEVDKMLKEPIIFKINNEAYSYTGYELGYSVDSEAIAKEAWLVGRKGMFWQRWHERKADNVLKSNWVWYKDATVNILNDLGKSYYRQATEATARLIGGKLEIVPSKNGSFVDTNTALAVLKQNYTANPKEVVLPYYSILAYPSTEKVEKWKFANVYSGYTTYYKTTNPNRSYNLEKAAASFDGLIIYSGTIISFNNLVGERSADTGYKKAPIFSYGAVVDGYGGGICQVASTLYAAVLAGRGYV